MQLIFSVGGNPIPKQSFVIGVGRQGGYTAAHVKAWQEIVAWSAQQAMRHQGYTDPLEGPVSVTLHFWLKDHRPKDLDNLSKAVLDGMNRVVWKDDRQIMDLHLIKCFSPERIGGVDVEVLAVE